MKKWLIPLVGLIGALAAITLVVAPIAKASPHDVPIALLSLDKTAKVQGKDANFGQTVITNLTTSSGGLSLPVKWLMCKNQTCINDALSSNTVYAAIVIPADFTSSYVAAQASSSTTASQIAVTIDQGKDPGMAGTVAQMMAQVSQTSGLALKTSYVNQVPSDEGGGMVATLLAVLMVFVSLITTIILAKAAPVDYAKRAGRAKAILQQVGIAAALAAVTGLVVPWALGAVAGASLPYLNVAIFIFVGFFAFATIVLFSVDWLGMWGLAIPAVILLLGLPLLLLPYEALLGFWQDAVYPWVPQRFIAEGVRGILFLGQSAANPSTLWLGVTAVIGLAVLFASVALPEGKSEPVTSGKSGKAGKSGNPARRRG